MEIEITIKNGEDTNTRRFRFEDFDRAYNAEWNDNLQELIGDFQEYLDSK